MAHAQLLRTNTEPVFHSGAMNHASRASQLSGSTAFAGSSSSLGSLASASTIQNGGPIMATANIINQKADASRSLYQICVTLKQRLAQVPGFEPYLDQLDPSDPVDPLWNMFRSGHPLLDIYNCLQPAEPLKVDDQNMREDKKSKIAIFKFVQACMKELKVPASESFVIGDLMGNDTTGFVKVTQVVNYVLDLAEQRGLLLQLQPYPEDETAVPTGNSQMSHRDYVVKELVDTERKYVQDLENLHDLKTTLEQRGAIPGDIVHQIFLNINAILDFQRRFLIRVETTNSMPSTSQRWGAPFVANEQSFVDIYQPFIANQRKAAQIAKDIFDQIQVSEHPVAADFNTLDGFLLKPMQRLVKYPMLLKDLNKKAEDEEVIGDLMYGCEAAERVLKKADEAVNQDVLDEALEELIQRVDDWRNHKVESFGRLLLHGMYGVTTSKNEQEKDASANKSKDRKDKTRSQGSKIRNKSAKLQLKGRIFMSNVTEVVSLSKPGSHSVQIWWKGDPAVESFTIKFVNEDQMKKWATGLEVQRRESAPRTSSSTDPGSAGFIGLDQSSLTNPYLVQDEDDDDNEDEGPPSAQYPTPGSGMARKISSNNLRQRSITAETAQSLTGLGRVGAPRFAGPSVPTPLNIQTSSGAPSPGFRGGDSYFSPSAESPVSSRTSTASSVFANQMAKVGAPQGWDENQRYTAPPGPRAPSRDGTSPNPYGRHQLTQNARSRSYSTPDLQPAVGRRQPSQSNIPAVPGIPPHLHPAHDGSIPRSQTGSPRNDLPIRTNTQSPGVQRERMHQHTGSLGGTMAHFPVQPIHSQSRQNTPGPQGGNQLRVDPAAANARSVSPGMSTAPLMPPPSAGMMASPEMPLPTQLKVRVNCDSGNYVTLVVAFNITYQSLIDRIDAKLARFTVSSIGKGNLKLRYRDEDGDFVTIESDDDIQIAFMDWREGMRNMYAGGVGEIELFCVGDVAQQ